MLNPGHARKAGTHQAAPNAETGSNASLALKVIQDIPSFGGCGMGATIELLGMEMPWAFSV